MSVSFKGAFGAQDWGLLASENPQTAPQQLITVRGWVWWQVLSVAAEYDNSASANLCHPTAELATVNNVVARVIQDQGIVAGFSNLVTCGLGLIPSVGADLTSVYALPDVVVVGDGRLLLGFENGDVTTVIGQAVAILIGERYRNKK